MSRIIVKTVFVALTALTLSLPAQAQFVVPSPNLQIITNQMGNEAFRQSVINPPVEEDAPSAPRATPATPPPSATVLRFVPNMSVRQRNLAQFVARTREQSPENADQMAGLFASTDIFALFSQGLAPKGLRIDNVADAYTVYWITAWEASRGISGDTSRDQAQAVKGQVTAALLATPQLVSATAAQKQELAEALLVQTALISASMDNAADDPAKLEGIAGAVRQGAQGMGLDLDALTLTPDGFVPAR